MREKILFVINPVSGNKSKDYIPNLIKQKFNVNEYDVKIALESGKLKAFGNDVWYSDPPENTVLADAPNVTMLPHLGASTNENLLRIGDIIEELIGDYVS